MAPPPVQNWQAQILRGIGAPVTPQNLLYLNDWAKAEGGSAANNPFNTTQPAAGASSYNSVGVRNYGSPQQGVQATIQTLQNGRYGGIVGALRQGTSARSAADALAASPWGTGSLVQKMLGGGGSAAPASMRPPVLSPGAAARAPQAPGGSNLLGQLLSQTNQMVGLGANPTLAGLLSQPSAAPQAPTAVGAPTATAGGLAGGFLPAGALYKSGRIDAGHDFQTNPGGPVIAPGNGIVVGVKSDPRGFGPSYPIVKFTTGPYAGKPPVYIGHTLATVKPGQQIRAGQVISRTGTSGVGNATVPGWGEIGYAPGGVPGRYGQSPPFR